MLPSFKNVRRALLRELLARLTLFSKAFPGLIFPVETVARGLKHISWNEEYIAQLVGAGCFPPQFTLAPGASRKGDLSWMRFSLKQTASHIARVGRRD
jgi:hypothetical protein